MACEQTHVGLYQNGHRPSIPSIDSNPIHSRVRAIACARIRARAMRDRFDAFTSTCARIDASGAVALARARVGRRGTRELEALRAEARARSVDAARAIANARDVYARVRGRYKESRDDIERDGMEGAMSRAIEDGRRACALAREVVERANAKGGELERSPQSVAHLLGIGVILSTELNDVAKAFDRVRETRFASTLERAERERRRRGAGGGAMATKGDNGDVAVNDGRGARVEGVTLARQEQARVEKQDGLEEELSQLLDQVRLAEKNVLEMSALSSLFATHVQAQAEQIESLYHDAIESSRHLDLGNVEMKKTISRKSDAQRYVALILFIATFGLLFLDWYSG